MTEAVHPTRRISSYQRMVVLGIIGVLVSCVLLCIVFRATYTWRGALFPVRPNTDVIVFVADRTDGPQVYVMNADGTNQTRLTYNVRFGTWWLPIPVVGGDRIPYILMPPLMQNGTVLFRTTFEGKDYPYQIYLDGSAQTRLPAPYEADLNAVWSPTMQEVATFSRDGQLRIMDRAGGTERCITCTSSFQVTGIAWSPNGQTIAFSASTGGQEDVYRIARDGTNLVNLTNRHGHLNNFPAWSPDGQQIAFRSVQDGNISAIYVMQADGHNVRQLTRGGNDLYPAWSPDGQRLSFTAYSQNPDGDIYVMHADGSNQQRLTVDQGKHGRSFWLHVPAVYCQAHPCTS